MDKPSRLGTLYNDLYGEAPPRRGIFFRFLELKRVGISLVEVHEKAGNSVITISKKAQIVLRDALYGCEGLKLNMQF